MGQCLMINCMRYNFCTAKNRDIKRCVDCPDFVSCFGKSKEASIKTFARNILKHRKSEDSDEPEFERNYANQLLGT